MPRAVLTLTILLACLALSASDARAQDPRLAPRPPSPTPSRPVPAPRASPVRVLAALEASSSTFSAGDVLTATIRLDAPAPAEGTVVDVRLSPPAAASAPAKLTVAPGETTATFGIKVYGVTAPTPLTITATVGRSRRTATVTVEPPVAAPTGPTRLSIGTFAATFVDPPLDEPAPFQTQTIQTGSFEATFVDPPLDEPAPFQTQIIQTGSFEATFVDPPDN